MSASALPEGDGSTRNRRPLNVLWIAGLVLVAAAFLCTFTVKEGETVVVARFGDMQRVETEPGLHLRLPPPFDTLYAVDMRTHVLDPPFEEFLTDERRNLEVDAFVAWRVAEPKQFLVSQGSREGAELSIAQVLQSSLIDVLTRTPLDDILHVNADPQDRALSDLAAEAQALVTQVCQESEYGVEILYVGIERVTFHRDNMEGIERNMRAERETAETRISSKASLDAQAISNEALSESRRIIAEARALEETIAGETAAEIKRIESEARQRSPELYDLLNTLELMEVALRGQSVILSEDHWLLRGPLDAASAGAEPEEPVK